MAKLVWVVKHNGRAAQMTARAAAGLGLSVLSAADAAAYRDGQAPVLKGEQGPELTRLPFGRGVFPPGWGESIGHHEYHLSTADDPAISPGEQDPDATAAGTTEPQEG